MIRNNGVTEGDCQMIRELDADKNLMRFTSSVQRESLFRDLKAMRRRFMGNSGGMHFLVMTSL